MGFFKWLAISYSKDKAIEKHRKMWRWLAEHPEMEKRDYLKRYRLRVKIINDCFACSYAASNFNPCNPYDDLCDHCPLDWNGRGCQKHNSLYDEWRVAETLDERAEAAREIAELPERIEA